MANEHDYCAPGARKARKTKTQQTNKPRKNRKAMVKDLVKISSPNYQGITFYGRPGYVELVDNKASPKLLEGIIAYLPDGTHIVTEDGSSFHISSEESGAKVTKNPVEGCESQPTPIIVKEVQTGGNINEDTFKVGRKEMKRMKLRKINPNEITNLINKNAKIISIKRKSENDEIRCVESRTEKRFSVLKKTRISHIAKTNAIVNDDETEPMPIPDTSPLGMVMEDVPELVPIDNARLVPTKSPENLSKFKVIAIPTEQSNSNMNFVQKITSAELHNTISSQALRSGAPVATPPKSPPPLAPISKPKIYIVDNTVYKYNPPTVIGHLVPGSTVPELWKEKICSNNVETPSLNRIVPKCSETKTRKTNNKLGVCRTKLTADQGSGNISSPKKKKIQKNWAVCDMGDTANEVSIVSNLNAPKQNMEINLSDLDIGSIDEVETLVDNLGTMDENIQTNLDNYNIENITDRISEGNDSLNDNVDIQNTVASSPKVPMNTKSANANLQFKITRDVGLNVRYPNIKLQKRIEMYTKKLESKTKIYNKLKALHKEQEIERKIGPYHRINNIADVLNAKFSSLQIDLLKAQMLNKHGPYSDEVKTFAREIYTTSPDAYDLIRKMLHLPHPSCFKRNKDDSVPSGNGINC